MNKYLLILPVFFLIISCSDSVTYTDVADTPTSLIDKINSYQSKESMKPFIEKHTSFRVIEDSGNSPNDRRPPFNIYKVSIPDYISDGFSGELVLSFFNDRLIKTIFYAKDFDAYINFLKKHYAMQFNEKKEAKLLPYTRIYIAKDYKDRDYICWQDIRLGEEISRWIMKYS